MAEKKIKYRMTYDDSAPAILNVPPWVVERHLGWGAGWLQVRRLHSPEEFQAFVDVDAGKRRINTEYLSG